MDDIYKYLEIVEEASKKKEFLRVFTNDTNINEYTTKYNHIKDFSILFREKTFFLINIISTLFVVLFSLLTLFTFIDLGAIELSNDFFIVTFLIDFVAHFNSFITSNSFFFLVIFPCFALGFLYTLFAVVFENIIYDVKFEKYRRNLIFKEIKRNPEFKKIISKTAEVFLRIKKSS